MEPRKSAVECQKVSMGESIAIRIGDGCPLDARIPEGFRIRRCLRSKWRGPSHVSALESHQERGFMA
jgi:hypothetical protein